MDDQEPQSAKTRLIQIFGLLYDDDDDLTKYKKAIERINAMNELDARQEIERMKGQ